MARIGINGFGRIGRTFLRAVLAREDADVAVVAANDLGDPEQLGHLLAYDSVAGRLAEPVVVDGRSIVVGARSIQLLAEPIPAKLPWADLGVDVVVEATRIFTTREQAAAHLAAGARRVVMTKPTADADATFVVGVNEESFDPARHEVVSNASCTTNCLAPMVKVLDEAFGVEAGLMTTVHAYTSEQSLVDELHDDPRRGRAAGLNIVPTSTGAARAIPLVLGETARNLDGSALRVPVADGSLTDLTVTTRTPVSVDQVNAAFRAAATDGPLARVLEYEEAPLVSTDIVGRSASCVFDAGLTVVAGPLTKVFGWYDNEWGYSNRLVDLIVAMESRVAAAA